MIAEHPDICVIDHRDVHLQLGGIPGGQPLPPQANDSAGLPRHRADRSTDRGPLGELRWDEVQPADAFDAAPDAQHHRHPTRS